MVPREPDAIYQFDRFRDQDKVVARVREPEVDEASKEVRFAEIYKSDDLVLAEQCEFGQYRLLVRKVAYASRIDKEAPHKGRVLRGVTAEILGYREQ